MDIDFVKYLPIITAIISVVLGYIFGSRAKKNERLLQYTEENLRQVFSPMYHEILKITANQESKKREILIDALFAKYLANETPIYKIGNLELLDIFYELSERYNTFKLERSEQLWNEFWYDFINILFYKVNQGYRNSTKLLYQDFIWQQFIQSKPYWMKFYFESMKFLYETFKGINIACLLLFYFSASFTLFGLGLFPGDFWKLCLVLLGLSISTTLLLIPLNAQYIDLTSNTKDNFYRRFMKKRLPNFYAKLNNIFISKKNYDNIPEMYRGHLLDDRK